MCLYVQQVLQLHGTKGPAGEDWAIFADFYYRLMWY